LQQAKFIRTALTQQTSADKSFVVNIPIPFVKMTLYASLISCVPHAFAQDTTITQQSRLNEDANLATGAYNRIVGVSSVNNVARQAGDTATHSANADAANVPLAAIQGLNQKLNSENAALRSGNATLRNVKKIIHNQKSN
jgi:hypothetical protein